MSLAGRELFNAFLLVLFSVSPVSSASVLPLAANAISALELVVFRYVSVSYACVCMHENACGIFFSVC